MPRKVFITIAVREGAIVLFDAAISLKLEEKEKNSRKSLEEKLNVPCQSIRVFLSVSNRNLVSVTTQGGTGGKLAGQEPIQLRAGF